MFTGYFRIEALECREILRDLCFVVLTSIFFRHKLFFWELIYLLPHVSYQLQLTLDDAKMSGFFQSSGKRM